MDQSWSVMRDGAHCIMLSPLALANRLVLVQYKNLTQGIKSSLFDN